VKKWAPVDEDGESWLGFSAVRAIPGTRDEVLLVPLPGHTRGHCGVAIRRSDDWLLHCGDAYFHRSEVEPNGDPAPKGLSWSESRLSVDDAQRRANQARLRELARATGGEVKLICSHDPVEFATAKGEEREARSSPRPVSAARLPPQGDVRMPRG
jgi:glyoxylase-like metal-dependent hydrolase (beta-lactamase superfamily II)